jgi:carboxypeptidase Taq
MTSKDAYDALLSHLKSIAALKLTANLLSWDQEAMMPARGAQARAEQAGALEAVLHERWSDPRIPEWLSEIEVDTLDPVGRANVREARRSHEKISRVPKTLAEELARTTSEGHGAWADARKARDFPAFAPTLENILRLTREYARCQAAPDGALYDALLDDFEPGATEVDLAAMFGHLREGLTDLREKIVGGAHTPPAVSGTFPAAAQLSLVHELAEGFGYDHAAGRIDTVLHPFCSGTRGDVRITTRVDEADPFNCVYSTIHEAGHALYEQGLDPATEWQPAGGHVSMGVHESQSRLCENQIGRSEAYTSWLYPRMRQAFGDFGVDSARGFYQSVNRVEPGFIRTEADELHYNLHIMLRFELERALISDDLPVEDLEEAWNTRFLADFGQSVPHAGLGVLQDVHWSAGLFGYFPTYALGNVYAGELMAAMRRDLVDLDAQIRQGELGGVNRWLREKVHRKGSILMPVSLIEGVCGHVPTEAPLLAYLNTKFSELYDL